MGVFLTGLRWMLLCWPFATDLLQFCSPLKVSALLSKPYSALWVFVSLGAILSSLPCSFDRADEAIRVWSRGCDENSMFTNQGHVNGEYRFTELARSWRHTVTQVGQRLGHVSIFLMSLKRGMSAKDGVREVQVKATAAESDTMLDIQTEREKEHIYLRLLWCITSLSFLGKEGVADEWPRLTGDKQSSVSPEGLKRGKWLFLG